jgi:hypothetical protein
MAWMSVTAAKSMYLRQMKGASALSSACPAATSQAQGRALIRAARSQFCPMHSY